MDGQFLVTFSEIIGWIFDHGLKHICGMSQPESDDVVWDNRNRILCRKCACNFTAECSDCLQNSTFSCW